jgi:hypothetical protein
MEGEPKEIQSEAKKEIGTLPKEIGTLPKDFAGRPKEIENKMFNLIFSSLHHPFIKTKTCI